MSENYSKSKTLATLEHHGEAFRIVRRRSRGKPCGGLVMVHGATFVAPLKDGIELAALRDGLCAELAKSFPTRESLMQSLLPILEKYNAATDKPCASPGLISYRCKGRYGWIMIGAKDHDDAMREARRSSDSVSREGLEIWDGNNYVKVY